MIPHFRATIEGYGDQWTRRAPRDKGLRVHIRGAVGARVYVDQVNGVDRVSIFLTRGQADSSLDIPLGIWALTEDGEIAKIDECPSGGSDAPG